MNYMKLGIYFSANIRQDKQAKLYNILGVHDSIAEKTYLVFPLS